MASVPPTGLGAPPFPVSLALAFVIEAALGMGLVWWLQTTSVTSPPVERKPFQVVLTTLPAPPAPHIAAKPVVQPRPASPPPTKPTPAPEEPKPKHASTPKPKSKPTPQPRPKPEPKPVPPKKSTKEVEKKHQHRVHRERRQPPPRKSPENKQTRPVSPTRVAPRPTQPAGPSPAQQARITAAFRDRVRAAVEAAVSYPRMARMMGLTGTAEVGFSYKNGRVSDVRIVSSSGTASLDQAALHSVRSANYPPPSASLHDKRLNFTVPIRFQAR